MSRNYGIGYQCPGCENSPLWGGYGCGTPYGASAPCLQNQIPSRFVPFTGKQITQLLQMQVQAKKSRYNFTGNKENNFSSVSGI